MYKLKNSNIVSRPTRIGNTFIGSKTDLGPYGYYALTTQKPTDAPEGKHYVDSGEGVYDEGAMTYTPDWILEDAPVQPKPDYGTKITRLAMRDRFTDDEKRIIYETAKQNVDIQIYLDDINSATYIDLSRTDVIGGVTQLEQYGLLGTGRADEILTTPVTEVEQYKERQ